jgi:hypothetical protein
MELIKDIAPSGSQATATVTSDSLNMRSAPSTSGNIIKTLSKGDTLTVTGSTENGWVPVTHGNDTGYVSADLISIGGTAQASPQQTPTTAFPSDFVGAWKRANFNNTLIFTTSTLSSSSQSYSWSFVRISGNTYTIRSDGGSTAQLSIRLVNGNIEISGDSGSGDNNWNGTWVKQ